MITLRKMTEDEFRAFKKSSVADYAVDLMKGRNISPEQALMEAEGEPMVRKFLKDSDLSAEEIDRVAFLVGHHHTFTEIDGVDWQILVEADYLANAMENNYNEQNIRNFLDKVAKTDSGRRLISEVFCM